MLPSTRPKNEGKKLPQSKRGGVAAAPAAERSEAESSEGYGSPPEDLYEYLEEDEEP